MQTKNINVETIPSLEEYLLVINIYIFFKLNYFKNNILYLLMCKI